MNDLTENIEKLVRQHLEKHHGKVEGLTIGEDIEFTQLINLIFKKAVPASTKSKTFQKARDKFS